METVTLSNGRVVGAGVPPYVIAEIGANHNGDMELAKQLIDAAKTAGADAAKFQSWTVNSLISDAEYERNVEYADKDRHFGSLREMVERYQLSESQHRELVNHCQKRGIDFLSTGFSPAEVDLLDSLDVPAFKVASMDINHLPLLEYIGSKRRPVMLSTGMATLSEIARAVDVLRGAGQSQIVLLHCVSIYPPEPSMVNLKNIGGLRSSFRVPVGFSDHSLGTSIPVAAVALGACVVEKHFTLDKHMEGWDHAISADSEDLTRLVAECRETYTALGSTERVVGEAEVAKRSKFRRRLVLRVAVKRGHVLTADDFDFKRPGTGIGPDEMSYVLRRTLKRDCPAGHELDWDDLN